MPKRKLGPESRYKINQLRDAMGQDQPTLVAEMMQQMPEGKVRDQAERDFNEYARTHPGILEKAMDKEEKKNLAKTRSAMKKKSHEAQKSRLGTFTALGQKGTKKSLGKMAKESTAALSRADAIRRAFMKAQ